MLRSVPIKIEGKTYIAEQQEETLPSNGATQGESIFYMILNEVGESIGNLAVGVTHSANAIWAENHLKHKDFENLFARIIPYIPLAAGLNDFTSEGDACVKLIIHSSDTRYDQEKKTQFVRAQASPEALVKHLVYDDQMTNTKVQKDILRYLYDRHMVDKNDMAETADMAKALYLDEMTVYRNVGYLSDLGYLEGRQLSGTPGLTYLSILTSGVLFITEDMIELHAGNTPINYYGDIVHGNKQINNFNGGQNIVNSTVTNSFNIHNVYQKVDEINSKIDLEYEGVDKEIIKEELEEIKTLAADKGNTSRIQKIIGNTTTRVSEAAGIVSLLLQLKQMFPG